MSYNYLRSYYTRKIRTMATMSQLPENKFIILKKDTVQKVILDNSNSTSSIPIVGGPADLISYKKGKEKCRKFKKKENLNQNDLLEGSILLSSPQYERSIVCSCSSCNGSSLRIKKTGRSFQTRKTRTIAVMSQLPENNFKLSKKDISDNSNSTSLIPVVGGANNLILYRKGGEKLRTFERKENLYQNDLLEGIILRSSQYERRIFCSCSSRSGSSI